eukprot:TRINITY_DN3176_c3_g8_i1.p1 TRINITY_DN3176_c3_g8~~TRINITY_DN3176_c3_g8_i1.p1  ORF type:complete len:103 (-),score=16.11 TRINITY_DN3176_c3_g8_i1:32-340(-)
MESFISKKAKNHKTILPHQCKKQQVFDTVRVSCSEQSGWISHKRHLLIMDIKIESAMTAKNQMIHDSKDTSVHSRLTRNYKASSRKPREEQSKFIGKKEKGY